MAGHFWPFLDWLQMDLRSVTFAAEPRFGRMGSFPIPQHHASLKHDVLNLHLAMVCVHEPPLKLTPFCRFLQFGGCFGRTAMKWPKLHLFGCFFFDRAADA